MDYLTAFERSDALSLDAFILWKIAEEAKENGDEKRLKAALWIIADNNQDEYEGLCTEMGIQS